MKSLKLNKNLIVITVAIFAAVPVTLMAAEPSANNTSIPNPGHATKTTTGGDPTVMNKVGPDDYNGNNPSRKMDSAKALEQSKTDPKSNPGSTGNK